VVPIQKKERIIQNMTVVIHIVVKPQAQDVWEQCAEKNVRRWRWLSFGLSRGVVRYEFTDVSEVVAVSINKAFLEAASTSETSVTFYKQPKRQSSSYWSPWNHEISGKCLNLQKLPRVWETLNNEKHHNLYSSSNNFSVVRSRRMG
jgi:hypothetical protein